MTPKQLEVQADAMAPMPQADKAPSGTFRNAHLISPYFRIENAKSDMSKWARPYKSARLNKLRLRLAEVRSRWGVVTQSGMDDRPQGSRVLTDKTQHLRSQDLQCRRPHNVSLDFVFPADQLYVPGLTWQFRTGFYRREMDRTPLFECVGLEG